MVELTIDGKKVSVPEGSMVMEAAQKLGIYVPHFCYHKKLSIAANCRMCLIEVEKGRKPMPACATPVTEGMVVYTSSKMAKDAQKAVMEFLLINHPLDCPICDQGGECQLQDLAVGYGKSTSRYGEEKRVVFHKYLGPLVSAEEMSRCIQCTRCIRFGKEIAGVQEIGMLQRGEHSEIASFVGKAVESELSGNMIDVCPVGALTSKPFRYHARTWELARRRTISPHDSVGTNIVAQVRQDQVVRVVPFENEQINECWITDRDRWSYEGLYEDRVEDPMIRDEAGVWKTATWEDALTKVAEEFRSISESAGKNQIAALSSPTATLEEMHLLGRLVRGLGSENIESRLRLTDENFDSALKGIPWLGMSISELSSLQAAVIIGASNLRKNHPLFAQRLRQAAKQGTRIILIDSTGEDPLMPIAARLTVAPSQLPETVSKLKQALADYDSEAAEQNADDPYIQIAGLLNDLDHAAVLLGNAAITHPLASNLIAHAAHLSIAGEMGFGYLTPAANTVGAYLAEAVPQNGGLNYPQLLKNPMKAYMVLHAEPLDMEAGQQVQNMLNDAFTVALTPFKSSAMKWARVILPVGPFTETSGTYINAEGRAQSFKGVTAGYGNSRPAWKVLRVLGNLLKLSNFDYESSESIRDEVLARSISSLLNNEVAIEPYNPSWAQSNFERVTDLPIYRSDAIVRRSEPLQKMTPQPFIALNQKEIDALELKEGDLLRVKSNAGEVKLPFKLNAALPDKTVRIPLGFEETFALGSAYSHLSVEKA